MPAVYENRSSILRDYRGVAFGSRRDNTVAETRFRKIELSCRINNKHAVLAYLPLRRLLVFFAIKWNKLKLVQLLKCILFVFYEISCLPFL